MSHPWKKFEIGLITLELKTAFRIGSSESDGLFDSVFVTDANGLPCLPGESLAGILRHALADEAPGDPDPEVNETCCQVFGHQRDEDGTASRVRISFGHVHNARNQPVAFRGTAANDEVLAYLATGTGRDHVRIGGHGAVDDRGKFDELVVPAGARFTFELSVSHESPKKCKDLVRLLARPDLRLGGGTRRGLGAFSVIGFRWAEFDLTKAGDLERLGKYPVALDQAWKSSILKEDKVPKATAQQHWVTAEVTLEPIGTWMIGGPAGDGTPVRDGGRDWDRVPLREPRIQWTQEKTGEKGEVESNPLLLIPGSSLKGSLRHRAGFHARRLAEQWFQPGEELVETEAETELFGAIRSKTTGSPGRVHISDLYVEAPQQTLQHVSLDRFTQGPIDHMLFDELAAGQARIKFEIQIYQKDLSEHAGLAMQRALEDLCKGRLSIGAGRGHGRFRGDLAWKDGKALAIKEGACK